LSVALTRPLRDRAHDVQARVTAPDILSTIAHELRTPIAAVRGAVEALRTGESLPPETREHLLEVIARGADQLGRLADDLLAAARSEVNRLDVTIAPCDVAAVASEVVASARAAAPGASIRLEIAEAVGQAAADRGRLRQVLANLVDNAIVHGGGEVTLEVGEVPGRVTVAVSDVGPGVPVGERERIFEPYERLAAGGVPGTGLGLHVAHDLVAAMDGTLTVSDTPGGGATFTVSLPPA
jgi:two-component system sensor histidine kinase KdpD